MYGLVALGLKQRRFLQRRLQILGMHKFDVRAASEFGNGPPQIGRPGRIQFREKAATVRHAKHLATEFEKVSHAGLFQNQSLRRDHSRPAVAANLRKRIGKRGIVVQCAANALPRQRRRQAKLSISQTDGKP